MRTFLALELPSDFKNKLISLIKELNSLNIHGIKWVSEENLHITVQFIGDTNESDISDISDFLSEKFTQISQIKYLNPKLQIIPGRNPRLIWIHVDTENKNIYKIVKQFKIKLQEMGYSLDKRPIKFHITLGRVKKRLPEYFVRKVLTTELKIEEFIVSEATFYHSILRPEGPIYNSILKFNF